jgi:hypothetical protein
MRHQILIAVAILLGVAHRGEAYTPRDPKRHDVFSPNGAFVLDVDPKTKQHSVYAAKDRKTPLWSFTKAVGRGPIFLSDDGEVVAVLNWEYVTVESLEDRDCVEFYSKAGLFKSHPFSEICPNPRRSGFLGTGLWEGPIG